MCYVSNLVSDQIKFLKEEMSRLHNEIIQQDRALSDCYHELERKELTESVGYETAKNLQELLFRRRKAKYEMKQIKVLKIQLESTELKLKENESKLQSENPHNWEKLLHISESKNKKEEIYSH